MLDTSPHKSEDLGMTADDWDLDSPTVACLEEGRGLFAELPSQPYDDSSLMERLGLAGPACRASVDDSDMTKSPVSVIFINLRKRSDDCWGPSQSPTRTPLDTRNARKRGRTSSSGKIIQRLSREIAVLDALRARLWLKRNKLMKTM